MRHFWLLLVFGVSGLFISGADAQRVDDVLATSANSTFTAASLSRPAQKIYLEQRKLLTDARTTLLSEMVSDAVIELETKARGLTKEKLLAAQQAKVAEPTADQIQKIYNANAATFRGRTLAAVREQIVEFHKHDAEHDAMNAYMQTLRTKYKVTAAKDVNAVGLGSAEMLVSMAGRSITLGEFEQANRIRLNHREIEILDDIRGDLEASVFSALASEEAKAKNLDASAFIATEITDKLRLFTGEERSEVETALMKRLFAKYNVKILLREPQPIVQNILIEADDPQTGIASAPITVVMFTDFQCPACSGTHPILKRTIAAYGDKVRFVVRDFPLESIHENAFDAALAANAARAQGKFFEYVEILYRNQEALDRASLFKYAAEVGLNAKQFELDFTDTRAKAEVKKDQADGRSYGIGGTPAIFVNGVKVHRLSAESFRRAIDRALSK